MMTWRTAAIVLALICCVQRWDSCTRAPATKIVEKEHPSLPQRIASSFSETRPSETPAPTKPTGRSFFGIRPPAWVQRLLPQPGEKLRDYKDRIVPLAQIAIAPQRARVARMRDQLDDAQRTKLDAAVAETASEIEARVTAAVMNGDFQTIKPMTGVAMARDLLDLVDKANTSFATALTPEQAKHFDFADYLVFATKWEDALP